MKNQREITKEDEEKYDSWLKQDGDKWETGELGRDAQHTKRAPKEIEALLKPISIKFPPLLIAKLKRYASRDNMGYQTYIKQILSRHLRELEESETLKKSG